MMEEKIFFRVSYETFADSSLANARSVSLFVGQKGFWNLTQNSMNCFRLLHDFSWFLLQTSWTGRVWHCPAELGSGDQMLCLDLASCLDLLVGLMMAQVEGQMGVQVEGQMGVQVVDWV